MNLWMLILLIGHHLLDSGSTLLAKPNHVPVFYHGLAPFQATGGRAFPSSVPGTGHRLRVLSTIPYFLL